MNSEKLVTYLGLGQAVVTAGVTYWATAQQDGSLDLKSPMFYAGMAIAVFMAVKAYYTEGSKK